MAKAKKDGDVAYDSLSPFYMHECTCTKAQMGTISGIVVRDYAKVARTLRLPSCNAKNQKTW